MNFGEWLQLAIWDIKGFFGDKDAKIHAKSLREVNAQKTPEDRFIYKTVESAKIKPTGIAGAVKDTVEGLNKGIITLFNLLTFIFKYFPLILLSIGLLIAWTYLRPILIKGKILK